MDASRYEIVDTIASGDFAMVYRARDRDLGREVAVKQIHQQFLTNEQQLANYWREAQLLAQLQHPNVLTIYDIVRPRGWLILELMQGNLAPGPGGEPIDLDYLRVVLAGCLNALHFLHGNGVIHGDVKPSNMLVDKQKRVKIGDFGLARRASSDGGSLLKGTTKYMAPELVSNAFGAVGPASDLYSLGFSAYELVCGGQFETLFPGLDSYGRDKQIAWMMWHAAADRRLPAINRVLEGVPEDLALIIQRLVAKEQSHRYQSAADVLRDLRHDPLQVAVPDGEPDLEEQTVAAAEAKKKKRMRLFAILALCFSVMLCIAMLLPEPPEAPKEVVKKESLQGVIRNVYRDEMRFVMESADGQPIPISIEPRDSILVNGRFVLLENLRSGDRAVVEDAVVDDDFLKHVKMFYGEAIEDSFQGKKGERITVIWASRPDITSGRIAAVTPDEGTFTLAFQEAGKPKETQLKISVPDDLPIKFNEQDNLHGQKVTIKELQVGDRVVVHHMGEDAGRVATKLSAKRVLTANGVVRDVNPVAGQLTVAVGEGPDASILTLPVATNCEFTLNRLRSLNEKLLKLADLQPGDKASVDYDTKIVRVDAERIIREQGVIQTVEHASGTINVLVTGRTQPTTYVVRPPCEITLESETANVTDLRKGDEVAITHDQPGAASPVAMTVAATRTSDLSRWAILIGNQSFEDAMVSPVPTALADVALIRSALIKRYRMLPAQVCVLTDESLVSLEQRIPNYLSAVKPTDSVIVYVSGRAYKDDDGQVYLAPKNFSMIRMETSGLPLQWLVDQFEQCPSKKKLLLLDCSHGDTSNLGKQPSTAEMMRTLKAPAGRAALRTVTAIASCSAGQRGLALDDNKASLFPWLLTHAYSGAADKDRNNQLEPTELFTYLKGTMPGLAQRLRGVQAPKLFLPDDRPPRLTEDAKKAIRQLAGHLRQDEIDPAAAEVHFSDAAQLAGKELEPRLLYGLVLMKAHERDAAFKHLEELKIERPGLLLPLQGIAWLRFSKRGYKAGTDDLIEMISAIKPGQSYPKDVLATIYWAGQLREYAGNCPEKGWQPTPQTLTRLDAAVGTLGPDAEQAYTKGRAATSKIYADFDNRAAAAASDPATKAKIKIERRRLVHYVSFPFDLKAQEVLAGLDK